MRPRSICSHFTSALRMPGKSSSPGDVMRFTSTSIRSSTRAHPRQKPSGLPLSRRSVVGCPQGISSTGREGACVCVTERDFASSAGAAALRNAISRSTSAASAGNLDRTPCASFSSISTGMSGLSMGFIGYRPKAACAGRSNTFRSSRASWAIGRTYTTSLALVPMN